MTTLTLPAFQTLGSLALRAVRAVAGLKTAWDRRRLVGQLGLLDEHMLRDIGITHQDVASALAEPLYRDPSLSLADRAADTRRGRRATAQDGMRGLGPVRAR